MKAFSAADCCGAVREDYSSLSPGPGHTHLSRGKSHHLLRIDAYLTKHTLLGERTLLFRGR